MPDVTDLATTVRYARTISPRRLLIELSGTADELHLVQRETIALLTRLYSDAAGKHQAVKRFTLVLEVEPLFQQDIVLHVDAYVEPLLQGKPNE